MSLPNGEEIAHNKAIVQEILDITNHVISQPVESENDKTFKRLALADNAVAQAVAQYYEQHPIATNVPELRKLIMGIYAMEFHRYSKDDLIYISTLQRSIHTLKHLGYE